MQRHRGGIPIFLGDGARPKPRMVSFGKSKSVFAIHGRANRGGYTLFFGVVANCETEDGQFWKIEIELGGQYGIF